MHFRGCSGGLCTCCFNVFPEALTANSHILIHAVVWDRLLSISEEGGVIHRTGFSLPTVTYFESRYVGTFWCPHNHMPYSFGS